MRCEWTVEQRTLVNVGEDTTLGDGDVSEKLVQLLVVPDGELEMAGNDTGLLVVAGSVTGQLQNFSSQIFHDGGQVHWCSGSDTFGVVSFSQQTMDTTDRELESGTGRPGLGFTSFGFACFTSSAHDCILVG